MKELMKDQGSESGESWNSEAKGPKSMTIYERNYFKNIVYEQVEITTL